MNYDELKKQAVVCSNCNLSESRTNVVFGDGNTSSGIMFIGEAPGLNEDKQGKPFVGKAGKFLDALLAKAGLNRDMIYITNIIKCRPPQNRDPLPNEIIACYPYLESQINILKPRVIVTLGRHASKIIMEKYGLDFGGISLEHGKQNTVNTLFGNLRIVTMYHPAAAIYNQNLKDVLIDDFKKLKNCIE